MVAYILKKSEEALTGERTRDPQTGKNSRPHHHLTPSPCSCVYSFPIAIAMSDSQLAERTTSASTSLPASCSSTSPPTTPLEPSRPWIQRTRERSKSHPGSMDKKSYKTLPPGEAPPSPQTLIDKLATKTPRPRLSSVETDDPGEVHFSPPLDRREQSDKHRPGSSSSSRHKP